MLKKHLKNKSGFTLAELVVVLALVVIVSACLVSLVITINKNIKENERYENLIAEIDSTQKFVCDWLNEYNSTEYELREVTDLKISIEDVINTTTVYLQVSATGITLSNSVKSLTFNEVDSVSFEKAENTNLINIVITYETTSILKYTFNFRAIN